MRIQRGIRCREDVTKERCAISETGTGFAYAKLSGSQKPSPPVALLRSSG
jgi:hypothetical protein